MKTPALDEMMKRFGNFDEVEMCVYLMSTMRGDKHVAEQAAAELAAKDATIAAQAAEIERLREALKPFAVKDPIGIPSWWLDDLRRAAALLGAK